MNLYLVRHGESIGNLKRGFISGRRDTCGLTEKGRQQIIRVAWELRGQPITAIYSSPVIRARESSDILATILKTKQITVDWLTEYDHGIFENHFWWEMVDRLPSGWLGRWENYEVPYPNGESIKILVHRIADGWQRFSRAVSETGSYILVSHKAPISALIYILKNGHPQTWEKYKVKDFLHHIHTHQPVNGGLICLKLRDGKPQLMEEKNHLLPIKVTKKAAAFYFQAQLSYIPLLNFSRVTTASGNFVYKIQQKSNHYLCKIYPTQDILFARRLKRLYDYLSLQQPPIPAPKIIFCDHTLVFFPYPTIIQDYILGQELLNCVICDQVRLTTLLNQLYQLIDKIHHLPVSEVKEFWLPNDWREKDFSSWSAFLQKEIIQTLEKIFRFPLDFNQIKKFLVFMKELLQYVEKGKYSLLPLHGDLAPQNVIVSEHKNCLIIRLLDFERARIGDRLWDLSYFAGWLERSNQLVYQKWQEIVFRHLKKKDRRIFFLYRLLFHAWTVRDMFDYKDDVLRRKRGQESLRLLQLILSSSDTSS